MSTPILGPLQNGTRIQFAMDYDLPQSIDANYGDIIITDSLPNGLSWYSTDNRDHKNKVFIGQIQKVANIGFTYAGNNVTVTIPNSMLVIPVNQGKTLHVEIDTFISNAALIQPDTIVTNNSNLSFTKISLSGNGSTDFMFAPLDESSVIIDYPEAASPLSGHTVPINITFDASNDTNSFNYDIMCDFGKNLVFTTDDPVAFKLVYYITGGSEQDIFPVTVRKDESNNNIYHFIFVNTPDIVGKQISLTINPKTKFDDVQGFRAFRALSAVPTSIKFRYSIQIGGAQASINTIYIPLAGKISLRKSIASEIKKVDLTKTIVTK